MNGRAPSGMAVATVTLCRDPAEVTLLRRALTALAAHGWPTFVCDGGSGHQFVRFLRTLPLVTVVEPVEAGLVGQVRASLSAAAPASDAFVLYSEPDKLDFFERHLRGFARLAEACDDAGCLLASRSISAFRSFPPTQQSTEAAINRLCGEFLGVEGDYSYGPFMLRSDLVPTVHRVSKELGWGWRHFVFAVAQRLGQRLVHAPGDFECPAPQQQEDSGERLHRLRQLAQNVNGLLAGLTVDLRPPGFPSDRSQRT